MFLVVFVYVVVHMVVGMLNKHLLIKTIKSILAVILGGISIYFPSITTQWDQPLPTSRAEQRIFNLIYLMVVHVIVRVSMFMIV